MSDHEFEKQVQQTLGGLKLRPSDAVWMEVQKNIRRDKRRRRFFWLWTPMLFICLTTCAYILYRSNVFTQTTSPVTTTALSQNNKPASEKQLNNTAKTTSDINTTNNNRVEPAAATPIIAQNATPVAVIKDKQTAASKPAVTEKEQPATGAPVATHQPTASTVTSYSIAGNTPVMSWHKSNRLNKSKYALVHRQKTGYTNSLTGEPMQQLTAASTQQWEPGQIAATGSMPAFAKVDYNIATSNAVTDLMHEKIMHLALPDSLGNTTAAILPIQRKRSILWHWGVETDAGFSRISQSKLFQLKGLLEQDKYVAEDLSARANSTPSSSGSFLNISPTVVKPAAPIQPDFAFAAGMFVERALSKRFRLSVGLRYEYMSVYTMVGPKVVTNTPVVVNYGTSRAKLVSEYYKSAGAYEKSSLGSFSLTALPQSSNYTVNNRYKYRFQYLELPVMAHWQVNKGLRLPPMVFDGGFSISRLMSVDALHYEGVKGIYYKDNDLFNTTQANVILGFSVGLLQHTKHPMWVGPDLRYSLSGLVNKQVSTGQYMWSTGISVKILLGKL